MELSPAERLRLWAHELGGMAKTGLQFAHDSYDTDRCERTLAIAESLRALASAPEPAIARPFLPDLGIVTPKVGCSVAAFDGRGHVVLIQRADNGRWALPGGYAEIGTTPSANGLREFREETGYEAEVERLVGVYDNARFGSVASYQFYICLFRGRLSGGSARPSSETLAVRLVDPTDLPDEMSALQRAMLADAAARPGPAVYQ